MHKSFKQTSGNIKIKACLQLFSQFPCKHYISASCHRLLQWKEEEVIRKILDFLNLNSELR